MRGKGIASIANRSDVESKAGEIAAIFQQSGLPMNRLDEFIKSEKDVTKYLNIIEGSAKSKVKQSIQPKPLMKSSKPGDVIDFPPERITDWTKARPQPPEIEMIDGIQTTRGMGDLFSKQMKNIGKKDPALYEDRGGNIIPAQFEIHPTSEIAKSLRLEAEAAKKLKNMSEAEIKLRGNRPYDTDEQIIARIEKQNKEAAERLRNKKNKDLEDPEKFAAGGVAGLLGERTGYAVGNQVMPAVDPRMNVDYNTLVDQNTAQRATQAQARNPVLQRMQQNQANQTSFGDRVAQVSEAMAGKTGQEVIPEYGMQTGYDFQKKSNMNPVASSILASGYQLGQEGLRALNPMGDNFLNFKKAYETANQQAGENIEGILTADTGTISAEQQANRNKYLESVGQQSDAASTPTQDANTNLTQYSNIPELTRLINDNSNINSLAEANDYLKMQTAYEDFLGIGPGQKYQLRGNEISLEDFKKNVYDPNKQTLASGGRAGFYQGGQAQIEPDLSGIGHGSDALMARNMLIAPGSQATTSTGLNYLLGEDNDTTRVPYKEKGSVTLADLIKVNASGNKSGKNQIMGAPDGITADTETFNAIIKMDIPIMEKINLLGSYGYGKDRFKVEKGNKELFLGEDGYKDRNIGLGFNQDGEGLSGSVIRNLETGDNDYQLKLLKSFAEGGRIGYNEGNMVLPKPKAMDEYLLKQVMSQAGANTLDVRTREMFIEELKKKIRDKRATEEKKYQFEELRDQGAEDMYYNNREKELDIKYNPQNYPPSMRKFAGGGLAGLLGEGPGSTDHGPRTFNQGERVPMLYGGGIYKVIIENLSKLRKIKPSEYLKLRNYKSLPTNVKNLMPKTELEKLKEARIEMVENLVDMATTSKSYEKNIKNVADEFSKMGLDGDDYLNMMRKDLKSPVPFGVTDKDILQGELILKNLKTKGNRQLNAQGGRIGYEEAGVVDKIGGMVNYKNVPHYLAKPLKGVTNIAEWMGRLPFATAELASDIIRKPLFKPGDRVPGLPGLGARFVGDETFKKFINNMTTGALAENLGLTALADKTGENLTDEARTVGDILESLGEFANAGGLLAAGKNLFKGKGVGDVVKKIKKRLKENKDEALTAQGEGRRDFNKTAAAGAGVIALKSMGLGSLTKQTKKLDDIQIQVRGDQDYDYADEMWNGSTWANIQFKALTKKGTEILEDLTKAKGSTLTKEGGLYTPVGGSEEAAMIVQKLKPKAGLQLHMATNQVYNPATKSFSHPKGSIQEAAGKEHNKIYSGKDINKKKIMKEADDMIAHDSGGYSSMQFHDEYLDDILEQLAVK
jgi:hypothetical protein